MACRVPSLVVSLALLLALASCRREDAAGEGRPGTAITPSPNARILPSPLPSVRGSAVDAPADGRAEELAGAAALPNAPPQPPTPFPVDGELPAERPPPRESGLFELRGEFVWGEVDARSLQMPLDAATNATLSRRKLGALATRPELRALVSPWGHLVIELTSPTHALPAGTQLRARSDRWGHVIVWPDQRSYRVAPRGSLRAVFNERRVDVAPLLPGQVRAVGNARKLGHATTRREVTGPLGRMMLESALVPGASTGGALVCRFLLELARIQTSAELCGPDEIPVEAHYFWERGGELVFRAGALQRHATWPASEGLESFELPPAMPIFKPGELPPEDSPLLWPSSARSELWGPEDGGAELLLTNPREVPMFVVADRLPLARVAALSTARWTTARRPRNVAFRDFLGENVFPARNVDVPGELSLGPPPPPAPEPVAEAEPAALDP